jgi:hypothetical protein
MGVAVALAPKIFVVMSAPPISTHGGAAGNHIFDREREQPYGDKRLRYPA